MSNNVTNLELEVAEDVPFAEVPVTQEPEAPAEPQKPKKKGLGYRLCAVLLLALCAAAIVLPLSVITAVTGGYAVEELAMYNVVMAIIDGGKASFHGIPMIAPTETFGLVANFALYFFLLTIVVSVILSIVGICAGKNCPVRAAAFFLTAGFTIYTLVVYAVSGLALNNAKIDYYLVIGLGAALLLYFVLSAIKGKKAWYNLLQYLLTVAFTGSVMLSIVKGYAGIDALIKGSNGNIFKILFLVAIVITALVLFVTMLRLAAKKGFRFELICYILEFVAAALLVYVSLSKEKLNVIQTYAIAAAACAFVQIVIVAIILAVRKNKKKAEAPAAEEDVAPEAVAYEGGPIPVEMAEAVPVAEEVPVAEAVPEEKAPVETAEYDYYNSRAFDPFIASLNAEERNQFTELFILKYKGTMSELPDYVVGGDNKAFFNKLFIYLGQYRDRIPDGLMAKLYLYSTKI